MWQDEDNTQGDSEWLVDDGEADELHVTAATSVEFTLEEPMKARVFLFDGLFTGLFVPFRLIYELFAACCCSTQDEEGQLTAGEQSGTLWLLTFPLGTKLGCMPILCIAFYGCIAAIVLELVFGIDPTNLRTLQYIGTRVSIGDPIVASTVYVTLVVVAALALSHHPRLVFSRSTDAPFQFSLLPGEEGATMTAGDDTYGVNPDATAYTTASKVSSARDERRQKTVTSVGLGTMQGLKPRRYAPFSHVLLDEIPPMNVAAWAEGTEEGNMQGSDNFFMYDRMEWFEPQRRNRRDIDESLALFKQAWSEEQQKEIQRHVERRRALLARDAAAKNGTTEEDGARRPTKLADMDSADITILNPNAIEWRASDVFKFTIGDYVRRNEEFPEMAVCFDGVNRVTPDEVYVISNRMWADRCALYCIEGAAETHQWQAIEGLFDIAQEMQPQEGQEDPRVADRVVNMEAMLLCMSGRDVLRRVDAFANGNTSCTVAAVSVPGVWVLLYLLIAAGIAVVPLVVRVALSGNLHGRQTYYNIMAAYIPLALIFLCTTVLLTVFEGVRRSMSNFRESVDSFTEITLNAGRAQWAPVLNWYEQTNVRSWFLLRQHILSSFRHHLTARVAAAVVVGLPLSAAWAVFCVIYTLTAPGARPAVDGWVFQAACFSFAMTASAIRILSDAVWVNDTVQSHRGLLAKVQAALEEEIMIVASMEAMALAASGGTLNGLSTIAAMQAAGVPEGTFTAEGGPESMASQGSRAAVSVLATQSTELQLLIDAKALLEDVRFAIEFVRAPLSPFGFEVSAHFVNCCGAILILNITTFVTAIVGWATR